MRNDCVCHPARTKNRARVCINARQYFDGIEPETWFFSIGGYQVLEKWLKDRRGHLLDIDHITHLPQDRRCGGAYARFYATGVRGCKTAVCGAIRSAVAVTHSRVTIHAGGIYAHDRRS